MTLKNADLAEARKADESARQLSAEAKATATQAEVAAAAVRARIRKDMVAQTLKA